MSSTSRQSHALAGIKIQYDSAAIQLFQKSLVGSSCVHTSRKNAQLGITIDSFFALCLIRAGSTLIQVVVTAKYLLSSRRQDKTVITIPVAYLSLCFSCVFIHPKSSKFPDCSHPPDNTIIITYIEAKKVRQVLSSHTLPRLIRSLHASVFFPPTSDGLNQM